MKYAASGRSEFFSSHLIQDGVIRNLQTLAESSQRLGESSKAAHTRVDWKGLAGFRNVLVHDYLGVDLELVYRAIATARGTERRPRVWAPPALTVGAASWTEVPRRAEPVFGTCRPRHRHGFAKSWRKTIAA